MPKYLSIAGLEARHGTDFLDPGIEGDKNTALAIAIADAESLIDGYIQGRASLPFPGVGSIDPPENNPGIPDVIRKFTADIAIYYVAPGHDKLTKEKRRRYEDAIQWLSEYAKNEHSLGPGTEDPSGTVAFETSPRIFSRDTLKGLA